MLWFPVSTLIETAFRRVCPLYSFDGRDRPYLLGSGIPFRQKGLSYLITAAHVSLRDGKPVPLFTYGHNRPHPLIQQRGAWEYRPGFSPDIDLAVIELADDAAADLARYYWFSTVSDLSAVVPKSPGIHYLIAGYPASRNRPRPLRLGLPGKVTALITGDVCSVRSVSGTDKDDSHHFALALPYETVPGLNGGEFRVPRPRGMSGGGVWKVEIDTIRMLAWRPSLVGVAIEYHRSRKTFVASRIQGVLPLAMDLENLKNARNLETDADPSI